MAEQARPLLHERYENEIKPALMKELGLKNIMCVPKVLSVSVKMGIGEAVGNANVLKLAQQEMTLLAGQHAVLTKARKSIANYKLREGMPIGCMVTLRGRNMWYFLERLIGVGLPRVRDFKGLNPRSFDGRGNYNFGLKEQLIFPEIEYDNVEKTRGMNISIHTSALTDADGYKALKMLGFPLRTEGAPQ